MKLFHSVFKGNKIGRGTVSETVKWLEKFITVLFPENGIEWWSYNEGRGTGLKGFLSLPTYKEIHHFGCYVRQGNCEGRIIEIIISMRDQQYLHVASIKSFGSEEECQAIASAISGVLESMTFYEEIPQIVSMVELLPRATWWERVTSFAGTVYIESNLMEITVRAENEMLYHQNFQLVEPVNRKFYIESVRQDWLTVLKNMKARVGEITTLPDFQPVVSE